MGGITVLHNNQLEANTIDLPHAQDTRNGLLAAFFQRYQSTIQLEHQPSEATLNILIKRHARRSAEFIPPN